ncbi:MAG TPA: protein kinase [Pyrinomonadaceae bacterium]|jgi:serine/threonine-protein kinase|nr:protein kinase [Pyrinomonadaceae bacterium]
MSLSPNATISHYRIISKIGAGGMGEVYLAQDTKLDRKVAIKFLNEEFSRDPDKLKRFIQEAKAASALNHPNILTVYEIGEVNGKNYIATELIDGKTLREQLSQKDPRPLNKILKVGVQVAEALSAAHAAGIIHRDIKPENIMIRRDGYTKVLDFGLAKLAERRDTETRGYGDAETQKGEEERNTLIAASPRRPISASINTNPGVVMGTVFYMSPEQGRGNPTDARTDIWSLGAVLYEMIAQRVPFSGETVSHTMVAILEKEPAALENVPAELQRIVRKALTKDVEMRYQSARDLLIDLKNLRRELDIKGEIERSVVPNREATTDVLAESDTRAYPVTRSDHTTPTQSAKSTSSLEYAVSQAKSHKLTLLIGAVVVVFGAVTLAAYLRGRNPDASIDSIAVLPFENRSSDAETEYLSDGLAESLIYRLSQLPKLRVTPTSVAFHYKGQQTDALKAGNELGVRAVLSGRIIQRGDNLTISAELVDVRYNKLLWGEQYDRKMSDLLATQREIAREIVDKLRLQVSGEEKGIAKHYTENNEAYQLYLKGRFYWNKRNEDAMQKSLSYFQQAIEKDPTFALAYCGLADSYILLGAADASGYMSADDALPKAETAALKALEIDETLAEPHVSMGHLKYYYHRDWTAAEREYKRALELNPNYATAHQWYAIYLMSLGRFDEAVAQARRAQDLDPLSLPINMTLGWVLLNARQYDQSVEQLLKTIEMDPSFLLAHHRLGLVYEQQGKYDKAIAEFKQVVDLSRGKPLGIAALAHAFALAGKRMEAQDRIAELLELSKKRFVSEASIAMVYIALGNKDQAFAWLEKADKARDALLARVKVDPRFDPLRSDPRFTDLMRRLDTAE